jgi:hypothetical protein
MSSMVRDNSSGAPSIALFRMLVIAGAGVFVTLSVLVALSPLTLTITDDMSGATIISLREKSGFVIDAEKNHILIIDPKVAGQFKGVPLYRATVRLSRSIIPISSWALNSPYLSNLIPETEPTAVPWVEDSRVRIELGYGYPEQTQKQP